MPMAGHNTFDKHSMYILVYGLIICWLVYIYYNLMFMAGDNTFGNYSIGLWFKHLMVCLYIII